VLFAGKSVKHLENGDGTIVLTGKDNIALVTSWNRNSAIDLITWEGSTSWSGCDVTRLPIEFLETGKCAFFNPADGNFGNNSNAQNWISFSDPSDSTPGNINKGVDDSSLRK
ncbi:MAG: hypothetical protein WC061_08715, partial [Melioribacteraceae bacterium]